MAKTNAERQAEYRKRAMQGEKRLRINTWVSIDTAVALERLARHYGVTKRAMLEELIRQADRDVLDGLEPGSEESREYFGVTQ